MKSSSNADTAPSGQPAGQDRPLAPGDVLGGRYELRRFVAQGGMGAVYEARDAELGRAVALKVLHERFLAEAATVERFRREVALALEVTHPHVCRVHSFERLGRRPGELLPCLTMEFLEGETLAQRITRGPLPVAELLPILEQLVDGLQALHGANIVHRDLKPSNVFLSTRNGELRVVLTDFGVAKLLHGPRLTSSRDGWVGSPAYMAPEQFAGGAVDARTDVYALGAVAFECLTGDLPFNGDSPWELAQKVAQAPTPWLMTALHAPPAWEAAIHRAMAKSPGDRFERALDFLHALQGRSVAPPRRGRRRWALAGALAAAALVAGAEEAYRRALPSSAEFS